jgi:hypothetical protein
VGLRAKLPPLWSIPFMLSKLPRMFWLTWRKDYLAAMKLGREVMGSAKIKTLAFEGYTPTTHDVFVCTYSKSGTYWMLQLVTQIAGRGRAEFEHIHDIVPWPEAPIPGMANLRAPTWRDAATKMRAIKTHAEAQFIPYGSAAKYVVVIRDPKDALISSYYFSDSMAPGLTSIGLRAWTDAFIEGEIPYGLWADHVASFWPWRTRENVIVVDYAEMKRDLAGVARRVAALMRVELSEAEIGAAVERSGFGHMKQQEHKFRPPVPTPNRKNVELLRSGKQGESAELLTPEDLARVDAAMKRHLTALGSDFPYDDYFAAQLS